MRLLITATIVLQLLLPVATGAQQHDGFDRWFIDGTMRIDWFHTGDSDEEVVALDQVYVRGTGPGSDGYTTATLTGSRSLTANGAGNITLVAGGIANAQHAHMTYIMYDYVQIKLSFPVNPLPSMSPAGLAAGALLMLLAVGYASRRRV